LGYCTLSARYFAFSAPSVSIFNDAQTNEHFPQFPNFFHYRKNTQKYTHTTTMSLQSDAVFQKIIDGLKENEAKAKAVNGVFLYKITKDGKVAKEWSKYR